MSINMNRYVLITLIVFSSTVPAEYEANYSPIPQQPSSTLDNKIVKEKNLTEISIKNNTQDPAICAEVNYTISVNETDKGSRTCMKQAMKENDWWRPLASWYWMNEWMKGCLKEFTMEHFAEDPPMYTQDNYTNLWQYIYGDEHDYIMNTDTFRSIFKEFQGSLQIFKQFSYYREHSIKNWQESLVCLDCNSTLLCECVSPACFDVVEYEYKQALQIISDINSAYIFRFYIDPVISLLVFVTGVMCDGTLLFIFIRHREMRTVANIVLINVAVIDFLSLITLLPMPHLLYNFRSEKEMSTVKQYTFHMSQYLMSLLSAFSILALSTQRFSAISKIYSHSQAIKLIHIVRYILPIWASAFTIIIVITVSIKVYHQTILAIVTIFSSAVFGGFLLPIIMCIFNIRTARKIKRSAREIPGERLNENIIHSRSRSSNIIIGLSIAFWFTHCPSFVWWFLNFGIAFRVPKYITSIIYNLFLSNGILNPLALYITSRAFRKYFNRYLFRCWHRNDGHGTMRNGFPLESL